MFFLYLKLQQQQKSLNMLHNLLNLNYLPSLFCPKFLYVNICFVKCFERMYFHIFCLQVNHFNDIMALVLAAIVVYCEFNPKSGKSIEYKIDICYLSAKYTSSWVKAKNGWFRVRIRCPSGTVTCLPADYLMTIYIGWLWFH